MSTTYWRETADGVYLAVKLQPRASRNEVQGEHGPELKITVTAPPVDAAANTALIALLSEKLQVAKSAIQLVRGQTSRHKSIFVRGVTPAQILPKLS